MNLLIPFMRSKASAQLISVPHTKATSKALYFTSETFTLSQTYLYQKDKRALPGNLLSAIKMFSPISLPPAYSHLSYVSVG
jgi:hypothetical protein